MQITRLLSSRLLGKKRRPAWCAAALLLSITSIAFTQSSVADVLSNPTLSKRAVSPEAQLSAKARLSAEQPTAEVLILVEKQMPQSSIETASISEINTPPENHTQLGQRRSTPSKVRVQLSGSEPAAENNPNLTPVVVTVVENEPQIATQPSAEVLILVEPINTATQEKLTSLKKNSSEPTPAVVLVTSSSTTPAATVTTTRRHIDAKVPVNNNTAPVNAVQQVEVVNTAYAAPIDIAELSAYLSAPSKTPVAAIGMLSTKADQLAVDIAAKSALIIDRNSREVLFSRNALESMPIASITKLMTAMVVLDAKQSLNQTLIISKADVDTLKNTSSRLAVGSKLSRKDLLHLTLMSSENRAAHALSRNYPGGTKAFVNAMNKKARALGMTQTNYVDPTGLSDQNRSSARDLIWLVDTASNYKLIKQLSTSKGHKIALGKRRLSYINSNRLIDDKGWDIALQKTGYIREAGYCMVLQTKVSNKELIMVLLDTDAKASRLLDAQSMREWVQS